MGVTFSADFISKELPNSQVTDVNIEKYTLAFFSVKTKQKEIKTQVDKM